MEHGVQRQGAPPLGTLWGKLSDSIRRTLRIAEIQKRKYPRVPLSIRVTRVKTGSFSFYHALNISVGGMFIKSLEPLPRGTELHLRFSLFPDRQEIEVHATVVWVRGPDSNDAHVPGMGLQFTAVSPEDKKTIETFVEMKL